MNTTVPVQHRGHERGHRLPEHVTERQEVEETDGKERAAVFLVFPDLLFDRDDVGQDVAVGEDDPFRLGRRAGREDDFDRVVARDGHGLEGRRIERAKIDVAQLPRRSDRSASRRSLGPSRLDVVTEQQQLRVDDARDVAEKLG